MLIVTPLKPLVPTNLQITSLDPTSIQLDWCGSSDAGSYQLWSRDINDANSVLTMINGSGTADTTANDYWLFPGVWNYEFAVSASNGDLVSGPSVGVVSFIELLALKYNLKQVMLRGGLFSDIATAWISCWRSSRGCRLLLA